MAAMPLVAMASTTWFVDARYGSNSNRGLSTSAPKRTIQAAINAASAGDTVFIASGTYYENLTLSKPLTLFSQEFAGAVVDGHHAGSCLVITEKGAGSVVDGMVFTHGAPTNSGNKYGGGVDCLASATVRNCILKDNGNPSTTFAGGLHTTHDGTYVTVENCLFTGNYAWASGGAVLTEWGSTAVYDHCTFYGNRSDSAYGDIGGVCPANTGTLIMRSSIVWGNTGFQLASYPYTPPAPTTHVSYSCIQGGFRKQGPGRFYDDGGIISSDPLFIDAERGDFRFREDSPCWRTGHPDYPDYDGNRCHMGFWSPYDRTFPEQLFRINGDTLGITSYVNLEYRLADGARDCKLYLNGELLTSTEAEVSRWTWQPRKLGKNTFVYESGHASLTTTVTVAGLTFSTDPAPKPTMSNVYPGNIEVEYDGGPKSIGIAFDGNQAWDACPNVDWITIKPTHGNTSGSIECAIAPYNEVATRAGTITFGGHLVNVFQYGRRIKLADYSLERDYLTHVLPITVSALATTEWRVLPHAKWISVVDPDNGQNRIGSGVVNIAISENPSRRARTGTVSIGTELLTITQEGRPDSACVLSISPVETTADAYGANGHIAVTATIDLPWQVTSDTSWLTLLESTTIGTGNGNVLYSVTPNPTVYARTGTIVVGPIGASVPAVTHTVVQAGIDATISPCGYEFEAAGGAVTVDVSVPATVEWTALEVPDWITVLGGTSHVGTGTIALQATPNNTIFVRRGTVKIANQVFTVAQKGRGFTIDYEEGVVLSAVGDYDSFSVSPDGDMSWEAVASDSWITFLYGSNVGTGPGEVIYEVAPYSGNGGIRTGTITIGDKTILVTQRAYDLSISPRSASVSGDAGIGEISVSTGNNNTWHATCTEPWITIESQCDCCTGSGTVRFAYTDNDTGIARSGKIVVDGEVYTVTQPARVLVDISAQIIGHGHVDGVGRRSLGSQVSLTAVPDDGYVFKCWTVAVGDIMQNPMTLTADAAKSVTATFVPLSPEFVAVESTTEGVFLKWTNLAWTAQYRIYRSESEEKPASPIAVLASDGTCMYLDTTADEEVVFRYWVEAVGADAETVSQYPMTGKKLKPVVISPSLAGDDDAMVIGDEEDGWLVVPSAGKNEVVVTIPNEVDARKVTVEVGVNVESVIHNGASVRIVNNGYDITPFLNIPDDGRAASPLAAEIKPEIAHEPLDPSKGAIIDLGNAASPLLTTPPTRPGLIYTLREGATLELMSNGASKQGDGQPWTPPITVKGGPSGFYSIKVEK